ncbi:MAG TPA: aminomethyl-transferring glycine dehydrogenase subunit GcvPB [Armatimonadota bacterium]|nr:aminomethyl-transferring glycine dehydrogenase subunit GcvPB [Armatimonadota bacterium]
MLEEPLVFARSNPGAVACRLPQCDVPESPVDSLIPPEQQRQSRLALPELYEWDVVRHYTRLSHQSYGVDVGIYPLGSCTMKYNPRINEDMARLPGLAEIHPAQPAQQLQGALRLMLELERALCAIGGMDAVTLQPPAGAQGEFTALACFRAFHRDRGQTQRTRIIVPDSSHGTNPASAARCGFTITQIASTAEGRTDLDALDRALGDDVAGFMLTNPNTLGLFESGVARICEMVHTAGGLVYCDGANMNALLGVARPGDMGFDAMHFNLHKTFSTPHGGGGPGAGPIGVKRHLEPYLPVPRIVEKPDGTLGLDEDRPKSIGRVHSFFGNFGVLVRGYAYILSHGPEGLAEVTRRAVLNANYMRHRLEGAYEIPHPGPCMHEFVLSADRQKAQGCKALDIAKRLIDLGLHPPSVYFPLIVSEAMMIEPTETETKRALDHLIEAFLQVARECEDTPDVVLHAPTQAIRSRLDEVRAAREMVLREEL